jgi:hypothetical protein
LGGLGINRVSIRTNTDREIAAEPSIAIALRWPRMAFFAQMLIGCSTSVGFAYVLSTVRASDIFYDLRRSTSAQGAQVVKRMESTVEAEAIIPIEPDRVVALAHDLMRTYVRLQRLRIE